jgi:hypothetical protein
LTGFDTLDIVPDASEPVIALRPVVVVSTIDVTLPERVRRGERERERERERMRSDR